MRTSLLPLLAVAVAAAPGCHESPAEITPTPPTENVGASSNDSSRMMRAMDPVARLLDQRQELELGGNQVAQLEAIQRRLAEQNNPLVTQLQDLRPDGAHGRWLALRGRPGQRHGRMRDLTPEERDEMRERFQARREEMQNLTPEEREQMRAQMEELRPVLEQLRENNQQALQEARAVLTEEQRTLLQSRREQMRERRGEHRGPRHRMRLESDEQDAQSDGVSR